MEKEWGKLHVAILEREKQLRSEFERWAVWRVAGNVGDRQQAGGALRWQGNHPRVSHCLRRKPPHTQPSFSVWGQQDSTPEAGREAEQRGAPLYPWSVVGP